MFGSWRTSVSPPMFILKAFSYQRAPKERVDTMHLSFWRIPVITTLKLTSGLWECILYELATNKKAFPNDWAVFQAKTSGSILDVDLDDTFDDNDKALIRNSIYSMLQIVPNSRPSSAQLAKGFAHNIENLQIAPPPSVQIDQHFPMKVRTVSQEVDASTIIDYSPSPADHAVPKIVAQGSECSNSHRQMPLITCRLLPWTPIRSRKALTMQKSKDTIKKSSLQRRTVISKI